jgi:hypothetical protein
LFYSSVTLSSESSIHTKKISCSVKLRGPHSPQQKLGHYVPKSLNWYLFHKSGALEFLNEGSQKSESFGFFYRSYHQRRANKYCCDDSPLITSFTAFCKPSFVQFTMIEWTDRNKTKDKKAIFSII